VDNPGNVGSLKRIRGGFRRMMQTELGEEQLCGSCGEFWPSDAEFFKMSNRSMVYECKACSIDRKSAPGS
jgi:hypothetical protein